MDVRKCTLNDLDWMLDTAKEFNDRYFYVPLNELKSRNHLELIVSEGVTFRTDDAVIIGLVHEDPMRNWYVLVELGWYSRSPRQGIKVLHRFIKEGKDHGLDEVRMTTLATNVGAERILQRAGFSPAETSHRLLL